jgi:hypothetical protein
MEIFMNYKERREKIFNGHYVLDANSYLERANEIEPEYPTDETIRDGPLPEGRAILAKHSTDRKFSAERS